MQGGMESGKGGRDKRVWSQPPEKLSPEGGQSPQPEVYKGHGNRVELTNLIGLDEGPVQRCRRCRRAAEGAVENHSLPLKSTQIRGRNTRNHLDGDVGT